jgi:dsRNA-specific ribonuclease
MEIQAAVENIIHYSFANPQLLQEALTAEGASQSSRVISCGTKRLALVGDALLLIVGGRSRNEQVPEAVYSVVNRPRFSYYSQDRMCISYTGTVQLGRTNSTGGEVARKIRGSLYL